MLQAEMQKTLMTGVVVQSTCVCLCARVPVCPHCAVHLCAAVSKTTSLSTDMKLNVESSGVKPMLSLRPAQLGLALQQGRERQL